MTLFTNQKAFESSPIGFQLICLANNSLYFDGENVWKLCPDAELPNLIDNVIKGDFKTI